MLKFVKIWPRYISLIILSFVLSTNAFSQAYRAVIPLKLYDGVDPERMINQIRDLTTPAFEGRELGTDGNHKAIDWASFHMQQNGLVGIFNKSFRQEFPVNMYANRNSQLIVNNDTMKYGHEFLPAYYSASMADSADAVFAGFGFQQNTNGVLNGKAVIMLQALPEYFAINPTLSTKIPEYVENIRSNYFLQAEWAYKNGAKAVFLINPDSTSVGNPTGTDYRFEFPIVLPARAQKTQELTPSPFVAPKEVPIPVFYTSSEMAKIVFSDSVLIQNIVEQSITENKIIPINTKVQYRTKISIIERSFASNLGGIFYGNWSDKYLLVVSSIDSEGQHPKFGYPYVGANSNGTSLIASFEMARVLTSSGYTPKYSIIFLAANAHRRQQSGLDYFMKNTPIPRDRIAGAIILRNLGSGPIEDSSSVYLRSFIADSSFAEVPRFAAEQIGSPVVVNQFRTYNRSNMEAGILNRYNIPAVYLEGGYSSFEGRISDTSDKLNYVKFYRLTQFGLETIWRFVFSGQPQLDNIQQ